MSGFDFESLRDPEAPIPGRRERDGVRERGEMRIRQLRNRVVISTTVMVVAAAGVIGVVAAERQNQPEIIVGGSGSTSTTPISSATTSTTAEHAVVAATTSPTTTQPRVTSSDSAESSSWVSPQHGWVLEKSGRIDETTDGGGTWHTVGDLPHGGGNTNIRFADATRGFAFHSTGGAGTKPIYATSDGGARWTRLATPFKDVFALAASRGIVYAVAADDRPFQFRIWSSRADALSWTEDPMRIGPGAGPVPSIQLVLSGAAGWVIENDRVLVSGARLTPNRRWISWKELCPGYAQVTASSARDLVASCEEGVWTGPRITHGIYFSHDGGATFDRHAAPISGPVASPDPDTAVIAGDGEIERTTDGGLTWQKVHDAVPNVYGASDLGFTTSKQGFVIFGNGEMLMTYDAGETWQKVILP